MSEEDTSRRTVVQVTNTLEKLASSFKRRFPYGPRSVGMTQAEERKHVQDMPFAAKQAKMSGMGPQAWDEYRKELYRSGSNEKH